MLTYLRLGAHPLGLLINFDVPVLKDGIQRMALTRLPPDSTQPPGDDIDRDDPVAAEILSSAAEVHRVLGPGLLRSAYEECLCHELKLRHISHARQHLLPLHFEGHDLAQNASLPLLVDGTVPVVCLCTPHSTQLDECRLLARLRQTGWPFGLLINFNFPTLLAGVRRIALR